MRTKKELTRNRKVHDTNSSEGATQRCSMKKDVLKKCSKFIGEQPCQSVISIKLQSHT